MKLPKHAIRLLDGDMSPQETYEMHKKTLQSKNISVFTTNISVKGNPIDHITEIRLSEEFKTLTKEEMEAEIQLVLNNFAEKSAHASSEVVGEFARTLQGPVS